MSRIKINLLQGLRQKKQLKEMIGKLTHNIVNSNSIVEGATRELDIRKAIEFRSRLKEQLVSLKLTLQEACRPIQRDILMTSEIKDELAFYRRIDVRHGLESVGRYGLSDDTRYEAIVRKAETEKQCVVLQRELDRLFTKIDGFNSTHFVEVEEVPDECIEELYAEA